MKKMLSTLLASIAIVMLTACGLSSNLRANKSIKTDSNNQDTQQKEITIGITVAESNVQWLVTAYECAEDQLKREGVKYIFKRASTPEQQAKDIDDLIKQKVDAILCDPSDGKALTVAAFKVKAANIPMINFDRQIYGNYDLLVVGDNQGAGKNAADFIGRTLNGKGKIVVLTGIPDISITYMRLSGFNSIKSKYPDIKIVATVATDYTADGAYKAMKDLLSTQSNIDGLYSMSDEMTFGVLKAIKEANRTDIKVIASTDCQKKFLEIMKSEKNIRLGTSTYSANDIRYAVSAAVKMAKGEKIKDKYNDRKMIIPSVPVSPGEEDKFINSEYSF